MAGPPYRLVYLRGDGQRFYFDRDVESRDHFNIPRSQPHVSEDVRQARKFGTATEAVGRRDALRQAYPRAQIFIESTQGGDPLFEDRTNEVGRTEAPIEDRVPMHYAGFLFRPASLNRWCLRFPDTNFETLYSERGGTIEDLYQRLTTVPHLVQYAERYTPPEPTDEQLTAQIQSAQAEIRRAAFGPGRRRPGDH